MILADLFVVNIATDHLTHSLSQALLGIEAVFWCFRVFRVVSSGTLTENNVKRGVAIDKWLLLLQTLSESLWHCNYMVG